MARWPLAAAALFAVYFPVALWSRAAYVDDAPKGQVVIQLSPPFERRGVAAFKHDALGAVPLRAMGDREDVANDDRSPVLIYENQTPLGPAHNNFADIRDLGMGRFSHWQHQGFAFSASDNSDPNTNGRRYWAVLPFQASAQAP
jgi:hypothetical protein